jgi:hypothetical protein
VYFLIVYFDVAVGLFFDGLVEGRFVAETLGPYVHDESVDHPKDDEDNEYSEEGDECIGDGRLVVGVHVADAVEEEDYFVGDHEEVDDRVEQVGGFVFGGGVEQGVDYVDEVEDH